MLNIQVPRVMSRTHCLRVVFHIELDTTWSYLVKMGIPWPVGECFLEVPGCC